MLGKSAQAEIEQMKREAEREVAQVEREEAARLSQ